MIKIKPNFAILTLALVAFLSLLACRQESNDIKLEVIEIFNVKVENGENLPTDLSYKDAKYYNEDKVLEQQHYYSVDNKLKGFEIIKREGNKAVSNYYSMDSTILAIYEMDYQNGNEMERRGYDGQTKELLRIEKYAYDMKGNRISKSIYTDSGNLMRSFSFEHDSNGNEIGFTISDDKGVQIISESYTITKFDQSNRWLEKWGYVNNVAKTFHRRTLK